MRHLNPFLLVAATLTGCAAQPSTPAFFTLAAFERLPSILRGFGDGFSATLTVLLSLVGDARIYAWPNGGWSYDFGFVLGFASFFAIASYLIRH
jgi:hypothetical protein